MASGFDTASKPELLPTLAQADAEETGSVDKHTDRVESGRPGFKVPPKVKVGDVAPAAKPAADVLSARARLELLFDAGSFVEIDARVQHRAKHFGMSERKLPGDGVICGFGKILGRTVYAFSQDRTVLGGSLGEAHAQKIVKVLDLAGRSGCPVVAINDSGGARIQEGVESLGGYGEIFRRNVRNSGVIPQVSLLMGPCAGGAVYSPALTDFVVMIDKKSYMFVTGPKVVKAVTSEEIDTEGLGGGLVHASTSGVAHFLAASEIEGLETARQILSYLPSNNCEEAPHAPCADPIDRRCDELVRLVPEAANRPYDVAEVIRAVVDKDSFLEVRARFAASVRVGFARLGGQPVGIIANNPGVLAGVLDINSSRKAARFVRTCNAFGLPIVSLVDVPGFLPGREQEHGGIIDHGAKLLYAYCEATVPKLSVILRKAYGGAYIVMSSKHVGGDFNFAWPKAEIAVMGASGAVEILHGKELKTHAEPKARAAELTADYNANFCTPAIAEARGFIDAVIAPADTRRVLCQALSAVANKREMMPSRKNGNVPL
ncbi:MAG: acyl-CoA carboxylase subunit beta [Deltaproteobacteria bacterium]|nr:acyl-CoA carboxylase subunit beta [Deltaproteobacteria bacterium]